MLKYQRPAIRSVACASVSRRAVGHRNGDAGILPGRRGTVEMRRGRIPAQPGIIRGVIQRLASGIVGGGQGTAALALDWRHFVGSLELGLERNGLGERGRSQAPWKTPSRPPPCGTSYAFRNPPNDSGQLPIAVTPGGAFYCVPTTFVARMERCEAPR